MELETLVDHSGRHLGAEQLGARGVRDGQFPAVEKIEGVVDVHACGTCLCRALGEYELGVLECGDLLSEDLAILHVCGRVPNRRLRVRRCVQRDAHPFLRQIVSQVVERHTLGAEQVLDRNLYGVVEEFGRVLLTQSDLLQVSPDRESRTVRRNAQDGQPGTPILGSNGTVRHTVRTRSAVTPPVMNVFAPLTM